MALRSNVAQEANFLSVIFDCTETDHRFPGKTTLVAIFGSNSPEQRARPVVVGTPKVSNAAEIRNSRTICEIDFRPSNPEFQCRVKGVKPRSIPMVWFSWAARCLIEVVQRCFLYHARAPPASVPRWDVRAGVR